MQIKRNEIPLGWSIEGADFVNRLIQRKPQNRLGLNGPIEVKNHPWLKNYPWDDLKAGVVKAPFIPSVSTLSLTILLTTAIEQGQFRCPEFEFRVEGPRRRGHAEVPRPAAARLRLGALPRVLLRRRARRGDAAEPAVLQRGHLLQQEHHALIAVEKQHEYSYYRGRCK